LNKDKSIRIGIIGAGAAGLTAAETFRSKGYANVTILEKEGSAGGKCRSFDCKNRTYELGAGIIAANQKTVLALTQQEGVKVEQLKFKLNNLFDPVSGKHHYDYLTTAEMIPFFWQFLLKFRRLCLKNNRIKEPGFYHMDPALCLNFQEWTRLNGIELVGKYFERYFTGFGYGYINEVPAAYVLKYFSWETMKSFIRKQIFVLPDGIQNLWKNIALKHDVRYNENIQEIARSEMITVKTNHQSFEFDKLIWSAPLDDFLGTTKPTKIESELFSKIKYYNYQTYALVLENFPNEHGFIPAHFNQQKKGQPIFWYKRFPDRNVYTFYVIADDHQTEKEILTNISTCIEQLGGKVIEFICTVHWKYFPHVTTEDMLNGYYDRLQGIQGNKNTFFIGELLNFSMVNNTAEYAKDLIQQYF